MMKALFSGICLFVFLGLAQSTDKADFSGRWRMQKDKSDFAGFKTPDAIVRTVDQHGAIMNVHTVQTIGQKTAISDIAYNIDGTAAQNVINGREAESKTFWDGDVLVIKTSMKTSKGDPELIEDRWGLSEDKQTLSIGSHIETDKGGANLTMVCTREAP
jgi:hypothetical protein